MIAESIFEIRELPFINDVKAKGGKIYECGGAVRDSFLGKPSKDLDILITNILVDELYDILKTYGKVDTVGASFGVIKFKPFGSSEDIDIAIPRTERKIGEGHKGFEITADPFLPIEEDLFRRDFTINAMAKDLEGNLIDPYNGLDDLNNKIIRVLSEQSFNDDPLRMLRCVMFSARFNFVIEPYTLELIPKNAYRIKEISPERILIELEKIVSKGNPAIGAELLVKTGLYEHIFEGRLEIVSEAFKEIKSFAEFIFLLNNRRVDTFKFFLKNLKGDTITAKEIEALTMISYYNTNLSEGDNRMRVFNALQKSQSIIDTKICVVGMKKILREFACGKYPKSRKELAVNGSDIEALGFSGVEIGEQLSNILFKILNDKLKNNKEEILNMLKLEKC